LIKRKSYSYLVNFKIGIFSCLLLTNFSLNAQLLSEDELETTKTYSLEEALQQNPLKVYKLSLKKSKLPLLPEVIYQFKNLNSLIVKNNKLVDFPIRITKFQYLQQLDLSANRLTNIPKELGELTHLKTLYLHQNKFTSIPPHIKNLKKLKFLTLTGTKITDLPLEISELENTLTKIEMWQVPMHIKSYRKIKQLLPNTKIRYSKFCNCD